jgi:hypothetical protein
VSFVVPLPRTIPSPTGSPCPPLNLYYTNTHLSQQWTGSHFARVPLKDLGAVFHLGHSHATPCKIPSSHIPITVFDVTGVHTVHVTYCECDPIGSSVPPHVQLLRVRWFPATWHQPNTAFTFRLLNFVHKLQSNSKVNLYDFHSSITAVFDNAGLEKPLVRVPSIALPTCTTYVLTLPLVQIQRTFPCLPHLCIPTSTTARWLHPYCWWALIPSRGGLGRGMPCLSAT